MVKKILLLIICLSIPTSSWSLFGFNILGKADRELLDRWHFKTAPITLDVTPRTVQMLKTMPLVLFGTCTGLYALWSLKNEIDRLIVSCNQAQENKEDKKQALLKALASLGLLAASVLVIVHSDSIIATGT